MKREWKVALCVLGCLVLLGSLCLNFALGLTVAVQESEIQGWKAVAEPVLELAVDYPEMATPTDFARGLGMLYEAWEADLQRLEQLEHKNRPLPIPKPEDGGVIVSAGWI